MPVSKKGRPGPYAVAGIISAIVDGLYVIGSLPPSPNTKLATVILAIAILIVAVDFAKEYEW